jgi:hypothetical protein
MANRTHTQLAEEINQIVLKTRPKREAITDLTGLTEEELVNFMNIHYALSGEDAMSVDYETFLAGAVFAYKKGLRDAY